MTDGSSLQGRKAYPDFLDARLAGWAFATFGAGLSIGFNTQSKFVCAASMGFLTPAIVLLDSVASSTLSLISESFIFFWPLLLLQLIDLLHMTFVHRMGRIPVRAVRPHELRDLLIGFSRRYPAR